MNATVISTIALDIVSGIIKDMCGRGGLQEVWEGIDEETQMEIISTWKQIAVGRLDDLKTWRTMVNYDA